MNSRARIGIGLVAFLMLCLGGWKYWTRTPQYSLIQLSRAFEAKDRLAFEQYIDLDRTSKSFVEDMGQMLTTKIQEEAALDGSGFGALGVALASGMIEGFKPAAASYLKQAVLGAVEAGSADSVFALRSSDRDVSGMLKDVGLDKASRARFDGTGDVVRSGDIARVPLNFRYEDLDTLLAVTLGMERMGNRWRVTDVDGVGDYLLSLENVERLRLEQVNAPIRKEIAAHVELAMPISASTRTVPSGWFSVRKEVVLHARIRNVGKAKVRSASFVLAAEGDEIPIWSLADIAPGGEVTITKRIAHQSRPAHRALLRGNASGYTVLPQSVAIQEGGKNHNLQAHTSWQGYLASLGEKGVNP